MRTATRIKTFEGSNRTGRRVVDYFYAEEDPRPTVGIWNIPSIAGVSASAISHTTIDPCGGRPGRENVPVRPDTTGIVVRIGSSDWRFIPRAELDRVAGAARSVDLATLATLRTRNGEELLGLLKRRGFAA